MASADARAPWRLYPAEVVDVGPLNAGFLRVVLGRGDVPDFVSTGIGDEYVRLFLPSEDGSDPVEWPVPVGDGWEHPDPRRQCPVRTYTVRGHDRRAGTIWVDVARHEGGVAAAWAEGARPGSPAMISSPAGLYVLPPSTRAQVLVADATGLPAVCRLVEETPPHVATHVVLEVPGADHQLELTGSGPLTVSWVYGGNGLAPSRLEEIVRTAVTRPTDDDYIWAAGETKAIRGVRRYLRHELELPASAYKVVGYWTQGNERWFARYAALDDAVRDELEGLWASGNDEEEIEDRVTARLERLGL